MKNGPSVHEAEASGGARLAHGAPVQRPAAVPVPEPVPQIAEQPLDNILRWEDDGGSAIGVFDPHHRRQDLATSGSPRG